MVSIRKKIILISLLIALAALSINHFIQNHKEKEPRLVENASH